MSVRPHKEGLKTARLFMILSSISPLFILWAINGNDLIPDFYFITFCILMVAIPNAFLWYRIHTARRLQEKRELIIGKTEDHRDHILVYLFAILLPFYSAEINTWRSLSATLIAIGFIVFLFWHLNLHYMNLAFAIFGYRVFTVYPPPDDNPISGKVPFILITRCMILGTGERLIAYRLSDTVYLEMDK